MVNFAPPFFSKNMKHDIKNRLINNTFYLITGSGVLVNQAAPWRTADSFCKSYGSLIGLYNMVGSCAVSSSNIKREFWIGVFRNEVDLHLKSKIYTHLLCSYNMLSQL